MKVGEQVAAVGKRKTSVARVFMKKGKGEIMINGKDCEHYFPNGFCCFKLQQPLVITNSLKKFGINVNVFGGGVNSQAEAIRLGIARALLQVDIDNRLILKGAGMLSRDSRIVERKKFGHKKARKSFQFSKR